MTRIQQKASILSICIPTRGRAKILVNTLKSIYKSEIDFSTFEVVIYDSSDDDTLHHTIENDFVHTNIVYRRGNNDGFLNLIHALEMGSGLFLKLHNDYSVFCEGSLEKMVNEVGRNATTKPVLFFSNGSLPNFREVECLSFDDFLNTISFYSSWSTSFGIWKSDFDVLKDMPVNPMFPHSTLLFALADFKSKYLICNDILFEHQHIERKGGYNLFKTFAVDYIGIVKSCLTNGLITDVTFKNVKKKMFREFFVMWYIRTKIETNEYTFDLSNIRNSMVVHYSYREYYFMIMLAYFTVFRGKTTFLNFLNPRTIFKKLISINFQKMFH